MNEEDRIERLRDQYRPLASETVPPETRSRIESMIDGYDLHDRKLYKGPRRNVDQRKVRLGDVLRTGFAVVAAVAVFCTVVLRVTHAPQSLFTHQSTEAAGIASKLSHASVHAVVPYLVLLGASALALFLAWAVRRTAFALAYRYPSYAWLRGERMGVRWYDSARWQTYIGILFAWVMFAIFVAPNTTSPWVGVAAFLVFSALCGSIRYFIFGVFAVLVAAIPAWWTAALPSGHLTSWYPLMFWNVAFFILTPGIILIPVRNVVIRNVIERKRRKVA